MVKARRYDGVISIGPYSCSTPSLDLATTAHMQPEPLEEQSVPEGQGSRVDPCATAVNV